MFLDKIEFKVNEILHKNAALSLETLPLFQTAIYVQQSISKVLHYDLSHGGKLVRCSSKE